MRLIFTSNVSIDLNLMAIISILSFSSRVISILDDLEIDLFLCRQLAIIEVNLVARRVQMQL